MYPATTLFIAFGQLAIVILVLFSYPLQVHPCRNCLDKVFTWTKKAAAVEEDDGADETEYSHDPDHGSGVMSEFKHTALTVAIVTLGYAIAFKVSDLQLGMSLVPRNPHRSLRCKPCSVVFRGFHGLHYDLFHSSRIILLQGSGTSLAVTVHTELPALDVP